MSDHHGHGAPKSLHGYGACGMLETNLIMFVILNVCHPVQDEVSTFGIGDRSHACAC
jgi:hypothetical protein